VGTVADEEVRRVESRAREVLDLGDEGGRVDHDAVAEEVPRAGVEDARRDQVELEVAVRVDDRVAGVVAAAVANDEIGLVGEVVHHATLALVAPLGADDGDDGHGATAPRLRKVPPMLLPGHGRAALARAAQFAR
jgi:hypothetical protein